MDVVCEYTKSLEIVSRKIRDEIILVPIRNNIGDLGCIYTLNELGAHIWELLDECHDFESLRKALVSEFDDVSSEEIESDLREFLAQLQSIDAILLRDKVNA